MSGQALNRKLHNGLDIFAMGASFACLLHCLALPLLMALLPSMARAFSLTEAVHMWILISAIPTSLYALFGVFRLTRRRSPIGLGIMGLVLLSAGLYFEYWERASVGLTVAGSLLLVTAHLINWKARHSLLYR